MIYFSDPLIFDFDSPIPQDRFNNFDRKDKIFPSSFSDIASQRTFQKDSPISTWGEASILRGINQVAPKGREGIGFDVYGSKELPTITPTRLDGGTFDTEGARYLESLKSSGVFNGARGVPNSFGPRAGSDIASHAQLKAQYASLDPDYVSPQSFSVDIFAFEGYRPYRGMDGKHPLLGTGHLGFSTDGGHSIYGFGPIQPQNMGLSDFMGQIGQKLDFPGHLTPDTTVFNDIASGVYGDKLTVLRQTIPVSPGAYERLIGTVNNGTPGLNYRFPDRVRSFDFREIDICNCAQFPTMQGVVLPNDTGRMSSVIPDMLDAGATIYRK